MPNHFDLFLSIPHRAYISRIFEKKFTKGAFLEASNNKRFRTSGSKWSERSIHFDLYMPKTEPKKQGGIRDVWGWLGMIGKNRNSPQSLSVLDCGVIQFIQKMAQAGFEPATLGL